MRKVLNHLLELFPFPARLWIGDALLVKEILVVIDDQRAGVGGGHVAAALPQRLVVIVLAAGEVRFRSVARNIVTQVINHLVFGVGLPYPALEIEDVGRVIRSEVGLDLFIVAARVLLHRDIHALDRLLVGVDYVFIDDRVLDIGPGREAQLDRLHAGSRFAAALAGRRSRRRRASRQQSSANRQRACLEKGTAANGVGWTEELFRTGHGLDSFWFVKKWLIRLVVDEVN